MHHNQYKFKHNITILMCVHSNSELHDVLLDFALNSLTQQTFKDFKVLIVADSCERKQTWDVFDKYRSVLKINIIQHKKSGLANAKNFGLTHVHTDWVGFLDADDMYTSTKLQQQVEYLQRNMQTDILGTHYYFVRHEAVVIDNHMQVNLGALTESCFDNKTYLTHEQILEKLFIENVMCHGSVLMRVDILRELMYDPRCVGFEDWDLWQRCIKAGYKFANLSSRCYIYSIGTSVPR